MLDGLRTWDHTYAADSVEVYAVVVVSREVGGVLVASNAGCGAGVLAREATVVALERAGCDAGVAVAVWCLGDLVEPAVTVDWTVVASGRWVRWDPVDTAILV